MNFFLPFDLSDKIDHKMLRKSEHLLSKALNEENTYDIRELTHLRNGNACWVIIGNININSIKKKPESLVKYVGNNLDILRVLETTIFFQSHNFQSKTLYRRNRNAKGSGILLYIRHDIPSKYLKKVTVNESFEGFFVELNLRSKKWLLE